MTSTTEAARTSRREASTSKTEGDWYYIVTGESEPLEGSEEAYNAAIALVEYGAEAIRIDVFN